MSAHLDPVLEAIDTQLFALNSRLSELTGDLARVTAERDRLLEARNVLVDGESVPATPAGPARKSSGPRPSASPSSGGLEAKRAAWNKGKRAPQKPRECPVPGCGRVLWGGPALSSHMRAAHAEFDAAAKPAGRPSIDEIEALEAAL